MTTGGTPHMHQLQYHAPTLGVHGAGHLAPGGNLFGGVDRRGAAVAKTTGRRRGALGHDQPGTGALAVVGNHVAARHALAVGAAAGHRGHDDAVGQLQFAQPHRLEQDAHFSSFTLLVTGVQGARNTGHGLNDSPWAGAKHRPSRLVLRCLANARRGARRRGETGLNRR
ncbi:hypothetical protein D9M71_528370 [compost metagenome]